MTNKLVLAAAFAVVFAPQGACGQHEPLANAERAGLYATSIEQVLRLADDELDVATAALIVSEQWSDLVPGRQHQAALDQMALEILARLKEQRLAVNFRAVPVINRYLFEELGFRSIAEANDPNALFLHTVLDKKRGYCLSLSILYLAIGERLGLPVYGVVVPGHFFVRYDDGRVRFNIETTSKGGNATDEHYMNKFKAPEDGHDGIYMRNLSKRQTLGCFFNNLGNSYIEVGNLDSAFLALVRAVEINPTLAESRANLGNVYLRTGRVQQAIDEYKAALRINPDDPKTHSNLGNAYTERGWLDYAVSEYNKAIALDPDFTDAHKNLAIVYCKHKRFAQAVSQLKQALEIAPRDAGCYSQLGDVYCQMDKYKEALSEYKKALKLDRRLAEAYYGLGICYGKLGSVEREIESYKSALAIKPNMFTSLVNLGNVYFRQEKFGSAIELYARAIRIDPKNAMIYYNLGAACSNKGIYEQAKDAYSKAVGLDPKMGDAHYGLAFVCYQLGEYEAAWRHINVARDLGVEVDERQLAAIKSRLKQAGGR